MPGGGGGGRVVPAHPPSFAAAHPFIPAAIATSSFRDCHVIPAFAGIQNQLITPFLRCNRKILFRHVPTPPAQAGKSLRHAQGSGVPSKSSHRLNPTSVPTVPHSH